MSSSQNDDVITYAKIWAYGRLEIQNCKQTIIWFVRANILPLVLFDMSTINVMISAIRKKNYLKSIKLFHVDGESILDVGDLSQENGEVEQSQRDAQRRKGNGAIGCKIGWRHASGSDRRCKGAWAGLIAFYMAIQREGKKSQRYSSIAVYHIYQLFLSLVSRIA